MWVAALAAPSVFGLSVLRIRLSMLEGGAPRLLGQALEQRTGPVRWTSRNADTWVRFGSAVWHFRPSEYRETYKERMRAFQNCVAEKSGARADESFIQDWSKEMAGVLTPAEISWADRIFRRGGFAILRRYERQPGEWCSQTKDTHDPGSLLPHWERGTSNLLRPGEWDKLAGMPHRRGFTGLSLTCRHLWRNIVRRQSDWDHDCRQLNPGSEQEFSRVELEWWCAGVRCRWGNFDNPALSRTTPIPCRAQGPRGDCLEEMIDYYLATGRFNNRP